MDIPAATSLLNEQVVAALIAQIPGSIGAAAAAPVASAAADSMISGADAPVVSPAEALNLWAAAINSAISSRLAERIRQSGAVATTTTSFDPGLALTGGVLSVDPEVTYTYTASIPINESITVPGQTVTVLGGSVDPINLPFDDGGIVVNINKFTVPQTTLRLPDVTVHLGSPNTTVDVAVTVTAGAVSPTLAPGGLFGSSFTISEMAVSVDGDVSINIPIEATTAGPIQIDGFDLSGITGVVSVNTWWLALLGCIGFTCDEPVNLGVCSSASDCNHTVHIPDIKIDTDGPLLSGLIGGPDTSIPIKLGGAVGPVEVTVDPSLLNPSVTIAGVGGTPIPLAIHGDLPLDVPITARIGDFTLHEVSLPTGSWTPNSIPSSFAIWQTNGNWSASAPWADDAGTNMILPSNAIALPSITAHMPTVDALIGGPGTSIPLTVSGSLGPVRAAYNWFSGITIGSADGGEIPLTVSGSMPVDIPVKVTATPLVISGGRAGVIAAAPAIDGVASAELVSWVVPELAEPAESGPTPAAASIAFGWPAPAQAFDMLRDRLDGLRVRVVAFLDQAGDWLSDRQPNPLTEALSAALWQVRRTLAPVGVHVGQWGSTACVATGDCSDQDLTGANLSWQYLGGVTFTRATLTRADLTGANLGYPGTLEGSAILTDANLEGAILTGISDSSLRDSLEASQRVNLTGVNLGSRDLHGVNLIGANLTGANLSGANLSSATLRDANLTGANVTGVTGLNTAILTGANFAGVTGLSLAGADLAGKDLSRTNLSGANLSGATLAGASLRNANLGGANLTGVTGLDTATLTGTNLTGVDLSGASLIGQDLTGTTLTGTNLSRSDLSRTVLNGATLSAANLRGATLVLADLSAALLTDSDFGGAKLSGANLAGAQLTNADFTGAWLDGAAGLSTAMLTGATFAGAIGVNLSGADLTGRDLTRTNLSGANLSGVNLTGATLTGAVLTGTNLSAVDPQHPAVLIGADLTGTNLAGANLTGSLLAQANLTGADLSRANLTGAHLSTTTVLTGVVWQDTTCPDGSKTSSGCSTAAPVTPITIPAIQFGQGGVRGIVEVGVPPLPASCYGLGCTLTQVGISLTFGSSGTLPGASPGIVIDPITLGFLDGDNTALTAAIGGPDKGIDLALSAGLGPVTIPVSSGSVPPIPWHYDLGLTVDLPLTATVSALGAGPISTSIPFNVTSWARQGGCAFSSCTWSGWSSPWTHASGDLGDGWTTLQGDGWKQQISTMLPYGSGFVVGLGGSGDPGAVEQWIGTGWQQLQGTGWRSPVTAMLPYGSGFVVGLGDGAVQQWTGTGWQQLQGTGWKQGVATLLTYEAGFVAGLGRGGPGAVEQWTGTGWRELHGTGWQSSVTAMTPYGSGFIVGLEDGAVQQWTGTSWQQLQGTGWKQRVSTLLPYGSGFIVGLGGTGDPGAVEQWTGTGWQQLQGTGWQSPVTAMLPYGSGFVVGLGDGAVQQWTGTGWQQLHSTGWHSPVTAMLPYGSGFVVGLGDGAVQHWTGTGWTEINNSSGGQAVTSLLPYGLGFVAGFADGSVEWWQPPHGSVLSPQTTRTDTLTEELHQSGSGTLG